MRRVVFPLGRPYVVPSDALGHQVAHLLIPPSAPRDRLTAALQAAGFPVKLLVEIGRVTDSPGRRNGAAAAERLLAAEKIIFDDPFVQSMMRDFGAKIVPGSIKPI